VTLGSTTAVTDAASAKIPELLVRPVGDDHLGPGALDHLSESIDKAEALAIGPGLGQGRDQTALVERALGECELPLVLDADALNALEGNTRWLKEREQITVLTPHPGELARLLGWNTKEVVADRLAALDKARALLGPATVLLLKGYRSLVVSGTDREVSVVMSGGAELATAGTGDVLTGAIAALLRRWTEDPTEPGADISPPVGKVAAAAYTHGIAGRIAGERVGPPGVVAWDVAEALPEAVRRITGGLTSSP
jgi:NAD(P)H-hydrate epimerase